MYKSMYTKDIKNLLDDFKDFNISRFDALRERKTILCSINEKNYYNIIKSYLIFNNPHIKML